ncbi:hypothetical protein ACHQM5_007492 [Ranunculus cassubicifolius]
MIKMETKVYYQILKSVIFGAGTRKSYCRRLSKKNLLNFQMTVRAIAVKLDPNRYMEKRRPISCLLL